MIRLENITKAYQHDGDHKVVLRGINCTFERGRSVGIMGANGSGKSTLLRIIAGTEEPTDGKVVRNARLSFPLAFGGGFHGTLTGAENVRFACRIYGADIDEVLEEVENFAELGEDLYRPLRAYSSGMRARLAFGVSLALDFDVYLIDEITAVGDMRFKKKSLEAMKAKMVGSDVIMVSHAAETLRAYCTHATILHEGVLTEFMPLAQAMQNYKKIMQVK